MNVHSPVCMQTEEKETIFDLSFDYIDLACLAVSSAVGVAYLFTKHWLTCNFFGLTLAINAVELLNLGSFKIASTLLVGLFFYDIFWYVSLIRSSCCIITMRLLPPQPTKEPTSASSRL